MLLRGTARQAARHLAVALLCRFAFRCLCSYCYSVAYPYSAVGSFSAVDSQVPTPGGFGGGGGGGGFGFLAGGGIVSVGDVMRAIFV